MRPGVFLDRDDTLIDNAGDLADPSLVRLLPGAFEACRRLAGAGYSLVVVSNQGVVARGGGSLRDAEATNDRVRALLTPPHARRPLVEAFYVCPFHPRGSVERFTREHPWRKPAPGMILAAAAELGLDLPRSWLVGDAERDAHAALAAGIPPPRALLIGPGRPFPDLAAAAEHVLNPAP
ncbi:MAG: HAD-IIIA family hydrolase [Phycisphaerales bacterium]|nr:HAD-IIIA family hydrolase [Phycisphaerales bacterium]